MDPDGVEVVDDGDGCGVCPSVNCALAGFAVVRRIEGVLFGTIDGPSVGSLDALGTGATVGIVGSIEGDLDRISLGEDTDGDGVDIARDNVSADECVVCV